jgi:arylsulfatase A-like enzyme
MRLLLALAILGVGAAQGLAAEAPRTSATSEKPNIIVILADDLGTGDVKAYNPECKIPTPHFDALARAGTRFTDAHSSSAVCTPTRYGLLTGRYAWRSKLKSGVLGGLSPRLIEPNRYTLPQMLKDSGYHTACIGKWHLGMDWQLKPGLTVNELGVETREQVFNVDYNQPIRNGPNSVGFDYYFGISASLDMVPNTFIQNDRVTAKPTEDRDFPLRLGNEKARSRQGPAAPGFEAANVLPELTKKAVQYIRERSKAEQPFFLYFPLTSPHTPIAPTPEWQNKSGFEKAPYLDFVMQTDAAIGELLAELQKHRLEDNTLIIFTSDNGCSPQADFPTLRKLGHNPNYLYRGHKADIYEGGHRVPLIVCWPKKVKANAQCDSLVVLTDIMATCAEILGIKLPPDAAEDSISILPALGLSRGPLRKNAILHSINGSFAIRDEHWKLCVCPGSGGWSEPRPGKEPSGSPEVQLFDLSQDIAEKNNLESLHTERVAQMMKLLQQQVDEGRSTPGPRQKNTTPVIIRKK